jgi:DNA replication and repair protein RecF
VWLEEVQIQDLRNIQSARLALGPGLNVLVGRNAQGKTSVLEGVALLARGRSFRTDDVQSVVRRGQSVLRAGAVAREAERTTRLEVEVGGGARRFRVDGRDVTPGAYQGRLEVVVYSTDRLKVIRGPMRERRQFLDRAASALWPAYRQAVREYERVVQQRNAALERGGSDLPAWDDRLVETGGRLRARRAGYVARLQDRLSAAFAPEGERYGVSLLPGPPRNGEDEERAFLARELAGRRRDEGRIRRTLAGPHRDTVMLSVDGADAAEAASSGQARSLLLALSLAMLEVYAQERGQAAVCLLDDLDSELDEGRASALCREVARRGQALVTTAHAAWARSLADEGRVFAVAGGEVRAA